MPSLTPLLAPGADGTDPDGVQRRVEPRSNIFVVAALASASGTGPVRIRNMSRSGALIEGPGIPPAGSAIRLSRGSLGVSGEVVWLKESRAGVRFDSFVAVADWLPSGNRSSGQQRVDEIVYAYKAEIGATGKARVERPGGLALPTTDIAKELLELRAALSAAAEELAGNSEVTEGHPKALQALDMTAQKLEILAKRLGS